MRHSAATLALGAGVAMPVVKQTLGHSDIRVTQRYVHVAEAQMKDASGRMARSLIRGAQAKSAPKNDPIRGDREP